MYTLPVTGTMLWYQSCHLHLSSEFYKSRPWVAKFMQGFLTGHGIFWNSKFW